MTFCNVNGIVEHTDFFFHSECSECVDNFRVFTKQGYQIFFIFVLKVWLEHVCVCLY